jgi:hypothetical protein
MRRLNKSKNAPIGTAFLLFMSVAIIPVSLKAAGLRFGFNPRLSAAIDIWTQVAEVFGSNSVASSGFELASVIVPDDSTSEPSTSNATSDDPKLPERHACWNEPAGSWELSTADTAVPAQSIAISRTVCKLASRNRAKSKSLEARDAQTEFSMDFATGVQGFRALNVEKVESAIPAEVLNRLSRIANAHRHNQQSIDSLPIPKSVRVLIRLKQAATSSVTGAECKARAALDTPMKARLERALLRGSATAPDNCDL